ncbi:MAG: UDP-N-acetylmuramoyl-tripeptide--D-alanyl-D-alanine ligase [Gammaproteobacteria bacterium]
MFADNFMITMQTHELAQVLNGQSLGDDVVFNGVSTDSRQLHGGELFVALHGENFDGHTFVDRARDAGAAALLLDHEVNTELPAVHVTDTRAALGQLATDWRRRFKLPVVAVTGSNGKTTVKEMLSHILGSKDDVLATQGNLNNDIGVPLTLFRLGAEHKYAVIEMGANHAGEIAGLVQIAQPAVALITQCAPAHLEGFGSIEGVARAKAEIYSGLAANGTAVINADDDYAELWLQLSRGKKQLLFGLQQSADVYAGNINFNADASSQFELVTPAGSADVQLPLAGQHNIMNALAAAAAATALGIATPVIAARLARLQPVAGRLVRVAGRNGSLILDDTYNANPGSLRAALEVLVALPARPWLVLGDMGELGAEAEALHAAAGEQARALGVERLYGVGELSRAAVDAFGAGGRHYSDVDALNAALTEELAAGVVMLVKGSRSSRMERVIAAQRLAAS